MSKKKTQTDRAIEALEGEIAVLQLAIKKLRDQQAKAPVRRPRAVEKVGA
jgi:hypothetical protein